AHAATARSKNEQEWTAPNLTPLELQQSACGTLVCTACGLKSAGIGLSSRGHGYRMQVGRRSTTRSAQAVGRPPGSISWEFGQPLNPSWGLFSPVGGKALRNQIGASDSDSENLGSNPSPQPK